MDTMTDIGTEDERFVAFLRSAVRELDVPEPPREAMWAAIAERRRLRAPAARADWSTYVAPAVHDTRSLSSDIVALPTRENAERDNAELVLVDGNGSGSAAIRRAVPRRAVPLRWAMPIAAAILAVGVGIGHTVDVGLPSANQPAVVADASVPVPDASKAPPSEALPVQMVAENHFSLVEAKLASFAAARQDAADIQANNRELADWAQEMLTTTQMLLSTPVTLDKQQKALLKDLEWVLTQMKQLPVMPEDREYVKQTIVRDQLVQRLRYVTASQTGQREI
jgi:hypothetical protein